MNGKVHWIALLILGGIGTTASCAESDPESSPVDGPDGATIPEASSPEGGCEAGADGCTPAEIDCSKADFCPSPIPDPRSAFMAVWGSGKDDVWIVGSRGAIVHFDGTSWKETPSGTRQTLFAVRGLGAGDLWATSSREVALHSTGISAGAASWTVSPPLAPRYNPGPGRTQQENRLLAAWMHSSGDVWIAGEPYPVRLDGPTSLPTNMNLWRRAPSDTEWTSDVIGKDFVVNGLWSGGPGDVWAVGGVAGEGTVHTGRTLHTTETSGKLEWTEFDTQSVGELNAVWGSSSNDVWAVGNGGVIRHWTGATPKRWAIVDVPTKEDLRGVWGTGAGDVWAVGDSGTILHFDGSAWSPAVAAFPAGIKPHLRGVWGSSADDVWVVGDSVALHFTGKAGQP